MAKLHNTLTEFNTAKAQFLQGARNAPVNDGIVCGLNALDADLISVLEIGLNAGLTLDSPEMRELHPVSLLLAREGVSEGEWFQTLGQPVVPPPEEPLVDSIPDAISTEVPPPDKPATPPVDLSRTVIATELPPLVDSIPIVVPTELPPPEIPATPADDLNPTVIATEPEALPNVDATIDGQSITTEVGPNRPRPTTSGKSLEVLESTLKRKKLTFRLVMSARQPAEEVGGGEKDQEYRESEDEVDQLSEEKDEIISRPKKKRRVVSAARVASDGEEEIARQQQLSQSAGWETRDTKTSCANCAETGVLCQSFVIRSYGHPRYACCRCHYQKKRCNLAEARRRIVMRSRKKGRRARSTDVEMESEDEPDGRSLATQTSQGTLKVGPPRRRQPRRAKTRRTIPDQNVSASNDEVEDLEEVDQQRAERRKGKRKARNGSESEEQDVPPKGEEVEDADWLAIHGNQPGPSTGQIRRPKDTTRDIFRLYARIREVEATTGNLVDATAITFQQVRGDVGRLESDQETQKKHFVQELGRVEEVANTAMQTSRAVQDQVDSVRQQTRDIHQSLTGIHDHSVELTKGLAEMMHGFRELRFDLPRTFDDWFKARLGHEAGTSSTITGQEMRSQWHTPTPIPSPPALTLPILSPGQLVDTSQADGGNLVTEPSSPPAGHNSPSPSRPSSTELYKAYLNQSSSQDDLLLDLQGRQHDGQRESNDVDGLSPTQHTNHWHGIPQESKDVEMGDAGQTETEEMWPAGTHSGGSNVLPEDIPASVPQPSSPVTVEPWSAPSPISPHIVREHSVDPPAGLLVARYHVSPPSSQPRITSPPALPESGLLAVPGTIPETDTDQRTGPITRSRSRSRSASVRDTDQPTGAVTRSRSRSRSPGVPPPNANPRGAKT